MGENVEKVEKPLAEMSTAELLSMGNKPPVEPPATPEPPKEEQPGNPLLKEEQPNPLSGILGGRFQTQEELEAEWQNLEQRATKPDVEIPDIDEDLFRLNVIKKDKPEEVAGIANLLFGQPDSMQLLVADLMATDEYYKDKPEEAKEEIMQRYEDAFITIDEEDEDADALTKAKNRATRNMQSEAQKAKQRRIEEFRKIEVPKREVKPVKTEQEVADDMVKTWKPTFDKLKTDGVASIKVAEGFDYKVSEPEQKKILETAANLVLSGSIPQGENAYETLRQTVENYYFLQNKDAILKSYREQIETATREAALKEQHNPVIAAEAARRVQEEATPAEKNRQNESAFKQRLGF